MSDDIDVSQAINYQTLAGMNPRREQRYKRCNHCGMYSNMSGVCPHCGRGVVG